ncbi:endonuclease domain-containing protein [Aeromicrobium sp. Sec7.5]|uniref:endonuclease domain-containing protein n=1 Tax=Aeromicrobium sp. Sec7.5 TaxID=3121276 RepID=UPI002FE4D201
MTAGSPVNAGPAWSTELGRPLHRTKALPPCTPDGVRPAAAWIQTCADAPHLKCVARGDGLLHGGHATVAEISETIQLHLWRSGALQTRRVVRELDPRSASPQESRLRSWCRAGGLPRPLVNAAIVERGRQIAIVDLLFEEYRLVVEYEGRQHHRDSRQFARDVQRYADLRAAGYEYVQVTAEMLRNPRAVVLLILQRLRDRGYAGPAPTFGLRWQALSRPISTQR